MTFALSDLKPIKDRAMVFYERIAAEGYVEDKGDVELISVLAEDLRDVLIEYKVSVNSGGPAW